ncbi:NADP-dependent malic enzyme, partial [Clostridium perfringens]|uniref:phosphate acyltransferase n=1 Tax=Clostridium perfringens TaxID=1502 RepID=UPI0012BEE9C8
ENIVRPVLLGYEDLVRSKIKELELDHLKDVEVIQPSKDARYMDYVHTLYEMRKRKGVMRAEAERLMADPNYFASMAVQQGDADAMITGATMN